MHFGNSGAGDDQQLLIAGQPDKCQDDGKKYCRRKHPGENREHLHNQQLDDQIARDPARGRVGQIADKPVAGYNQDQQADQPQ